MTKEQQLIRRGRAKAWNVAHPERVKANAREYYNAHRGRIWAANKQWRSENRDKCIAAQRKFHSLRPWYNNYLMARARCTKPSQPGYKYYGGRGIRFMLTQDDVKTLWNRDNAPQMKAPSIDRIDSNGHYVLDNCQFLERSQNSKKARLKIA